MKEFNTPVLLITFNRPNHTRRVLEAILAVHPKVLYVFQDGAREGNDNDQIKCADVRDVIQDLTKDSDVELHTSFSDRNLGCGPGPVAGISWFFREVEQGIVMEDDCLPHPDFFSYCEELLIRYKDVEEVQFINAALYDERWHCNSSYDFSRYMVAGAWASWRRFWENYDIDLKDVNPKLFRRSCKSLLLERAEVDWWYFKLIDIQQDSQKKSYWDYQCLIILFLRSAVTIMPRRNLICNIGFDQEGTHTLENNGYGERDTYSIIPLSHPSSIRVDKQRDSYCFAKVRSRGWYMDTLVYLYQKMRISKGFLSDVLRIYKRVSRLLK